MKRIHRPRLTVLAHSDLKPRVISGLMLLGILCCAASSSALVASERAAFTVRLLDSSERPIAGAAVCLRPQWHQQKTLQAITNEQGLAQFPRLKADTRWQLLASKSHYQNAALGFDSRYYPLTLTQTMREGIEASGESCLSTESRARMQAQHKADNGVVAPQTLQLLGVSVQSETFGWRMQPRYRGQATHYRVSESRDMSGASWQALAHNGALRAEPWPESGYLQLKRTLSYGESWIEQESNILPLP